MLQSIRDHTQGWIAGTIISLLILSFALWGIHSYMGGGGSNSTVAAVDGEEITRGQLSVAYERLRRQMQMQFNTSTQLPEQAEAGLKDRALKTLINVQVLKNAALAQNYRISSRQIDNFLASMPEFQENGEFSVDRFQKVLETTLYNANDFFELIRTSLLIDQPRLGLIFTSFALPNEVADSVALINQERDLQYLVLPLQSVMKQSIQISTDKIQAYYQAHQEDFKTPEKVSIDYLELTVKDLIAGVHPTDDMLKSFYNDNSNSFAQPMQWKLDSIIVPLSESASQKDLADAQKKANDVFQKANNGVDFATLVTEFSLQKGDEKLKAGVPLNQVPVELQKTVSTLTKPGQVSSPMRASNGFVLLKVIEVKEPVVQPYEKVKDKVKDAYIRQQAEEQFADMREKLSNLTYEHPDSLEPAAKALGLTIKSSDLFTKDKGGKDISANNKVRDAAFSNDVLSSNNNSDVIQTANDSVVVIRIKNHLPSSVLPLNEVQKQITDKLTADEADARAEKLANEMKQKLQSGTDPNQLAQQYQLSWKSLGFIGRHANNVDSAILDTAFAMPKPQGNVKATYDVTKTPNGFAIIALKSVRDGKANTDQDKLFAEQIQNTQGLMEYELYKQSLMKRAKITIES